MASAWSITAWSSTASRSTAIADEQKPRLSPRAALRIGGLLLLFALVGPVHVAAKSIFRRSRWPQSFLAAAGRVVGMRVRVEGAPVGPHTLIVSNHLSWLDIVVLGGSVGSAFVSKDELGHGLLHWLADQNATVYVKRSHVKGAKDQAVAVARALEGDKPVTVFPEGTTGTGTQLLPFRSTLLEAANFAGKEVEVRPVAIDYGAARADVAWFGESGVANVLRILGRKGTMPVTVHALDPLDRSCDRKQLAAQAREAIAQSLGFKLHSHSPIGEAE